MAAISAPNSDSYDSYLCMPVYRESKGSVMTVRVNGERLYYATMVSTYGAHWYTDRDEAVSHVVNGIVPAW
jgi:hypothetical protein